jgi:hypothetical protein
MDSSRNKRSAQNAGVIYPLDENGCVPFTLRTFLGVNKGLAVWRGSERAGILFRGGWHEVTLFGASRFRGNGRRGNIGLSDLFDQ